MNSGRTVLTSTIVALLAGGGSGSVLAQGASAQALEEIVVTARRREETLQDLPLSIAAITAQDMETQGIYTTDQVAEFVPNVSLKESSPSQTLVFIRGIGGGHSDPSFSYGSGLYIDGHYIPYSKGGYMSTLDIERIEVLRGPQGTLFGKNTTGGAVNVISTKPQPEFDSSVTARFGDFGQQDLRGMLNVPLSDNVFARFGVASEESDGYWYNTTLNRDAGFEDLTAWRAALRYLPNENWTLDFSVSSSKERDDAMPESCGRAPAGFFFNHFAWDPGYANTYASCDGANAEGDYVSAGEIDGFSHTDVDAAFFTAVWNSDGAVGPFENVTVTTNLSRREMNNAFLQENDHSASPIFYITVNHHGGLGTISDTDNFELLFEAEVNDRLDILLGTWWFDHYTDDTQGPNCKQFFDANYNPANDPPGVTCPEDRERNGAYISFFPGTGAPGPSPGLINGGVWEDSSAIFGHMTYALSDMWDLELGMRYTEDERDWFNVETRTANDVIVDPSRAADYDVIMNNDTLFTNGWYGDRSDSYSDTSLRVSLTRSLEAGDRLDSGMVYFLISEGYLTGGFNSEIPNNIPEIQVLQPVDPEYVTNYEVGFKGTFADGRLRLNSTVFYMDYTDKQAEVTLDNTDGRYGTGSGDSIDLIQNAADAKIYGLELEMAAIPWDGGALRLDVGYLNNEYSDFSSFDEDEGIVDLSTTQIADLSPDWTLNASLSHRFELANGATLTPMLGMYWQSEYDWAPPAVPGADPQMGACIQDSYSKLRARVTYETAGGNYAISAFGSNITDELILGNCGYSFGVLHKRWEAPSMWGLEFTGRWGNN